MNSINFENAKLLTPKERVHFIEYDGIAKKNIDGFISIYSAIPNLSLQQLRNIAENSCVKMITPINHVVFGNNYFFAIYSREDGEIIITPNSQIKTLKELFTNEFIELNEGKAKVKVTKNKLIFFNFRRY